MTLFCSIIGYGLEVTKELLDEEKLRKASLDVLEAVITSVDFGDYGYLEWQQTKT